MLKWIRMVACWRIMEANGGWPNGEAAVPDPIQTAGEPGSEVNREASGLMAKANGRSGSVDPG